MISPALALTGVLHEGLKAHLYPGDGKEAAAILLCSRTPGPRLRLLAKSHIPIPHDECKVRDRDVIVWPGKFLELAIDQAEPENLAIILIHSHPGGLFAFSDADDASDAAVIPCLFEAFGDIHGTAIMTPDGAIRARIYDPSLAKRAIELVSVAGHDLQFFWGKDVGKVDPASRPVAFTSGMTGELGRLSSTTIGVSGTGSITAEQLARMGVGQSNFIDFDKVELRNLNRILNSTLEDAEAGRLKAEMFAGAVSKYRGKGAASSVPVSIMTREAVLAASQSDVLFCCVDTLEARLVADLICSAFLIPLFEVGVSIPTRTTRAGGAAIADVCGRIDYVQPGRSTLQDRAVYSPDALRAEYLRSVSPDAHRNELDEGYIKGVAEEAPSVITLNMRASSVCVSEFIARAYPFRLDRNEKYARTTFSIAACEEEYFAEKEFSAAPNPILARGAKEPLLGLPALAPLPEIDK